MKIMPTMGQAEFDGLAKAGMKLYAANGYTMAQEGGRSHLLTKAG